MNRSFVSLLCALLALVAAPALAVGQDVERPPQELWDEFPLEPSATPVPPTPTAQAQAKPSRVVKVQDDDGGMESGALIALMVAAGGVGAIAARLAARRLPRGPKRAARRAERKPAPIAAEPEIRPEAVATAPPTSAGTNGVEPEPAPDRRFARKAKPAPEARPVPAGQAKKPASAPRAQPAAKPAPRPQPAAKPAPRPQPAAKPAPRSQPAAKPAPRTKRAPSQSPAPSTGGQAGRFAPAATTRPSAAPARPPSGCSIKLSKRPPMGRFVASSDAGRVLARSPVFKLKRDESDDGLTPPDALRALVEELTSAGWRKTGAGRAPWELRFERDPEPAVRRRASPPRA
jgi:hypothetical protein